MTHRFFRLAAGCVLVTLCAAGAGHAEPAPPPSPDPDALKLDQDIQALKEEAVDLRAAQQSAEDELLYPEATRVVVYLSVPATALLVRSVEVAIDDGTPFKKVPHDEVREGAVVHSEAVILQQDYPGKSKGLMTVWRTNVPAGGHKILAEVIAEYQADADAKKPPYVVQLNTGFTKDDAPLSLELVVNRDSNGRPILQMHEWRPAK